MHLPRLLRSPPLRETTSKLAIATTILLGLSSCSSVSAQDRTTESGEASITGVCIFRLSDMGIEDLRHSSCFAGVMVGTELRTATAPCASFRLFRLIEVTRYVSKEPSCNDAFRAWNLKFQKGRYKLRRSAFWLDSYH